MREFIEEYIMLIFQDISPRLYQYLITITLIGMVGGLFYLTFKIFSKKTKAIVWVVLISIITVSCTYILDEFWRSRYEYDRGYQSTDTMIVQPVRSMEEDTCILS